MKRFVFALAALAFAAGCCGGKSDADGLDLMKEENFKAVVDGKPVSLYTLTNGDLTMQVTNFGARVVYLHHELTAEAQAASLSAASCSLSNTIWVMP